MPPRKKKKTKAPRRRGKRSFWPRLLALAAIWGFAAGALVLAWLGFGLPDIEDVRPLDVRPGITILAADGSAIRRYGGMKSENVALSSLPPHVLHAVLAVEDRRFYGHFGLDPLGLARAMLENLRAMRFAQGGSTITQQLAKNLFLTPEKTLRRKGQEALMALRIERRFSKDDILEAYLNRVYFGAGAYGIEAASRTYFAKPAAALSLWEGAMLAGLLKAPSRYSPLSSPDRAAARARTVLAAMEAAGYLSPSLREDVLRDASVASAAAATDGGARWFPDWVMQQVDDYVAGFGGDIVVRTTLNPRLQQMAGESARAFMAGVAAEDNLSQLALVTLAHDGAVLAMVGGADYGKSQFNRATQARRQPGSAFKPFVFLAALEAGYRPDNEILDAPLDGGSYRPENYDGEYRGAVTLADALAFSLNAATVRLLQDVGVSRLADVAVRAGFPGRLRPELASGLGAEEVTLLDLTGAYAVIAGAGRAVWPYAVTAIEDAQGNLLFQRLPAVEYPQAFSPRDTQELERMLRAVVDRGTGRAAHIEGVAVAGKTGTSQDYRDAWFVGYTDRLVTGVWMGNDDNGPMNGVTGGGHPARLWRDYMAQAARVREGIPVLPRPGIFSGGADSFSRMLGRWSRDGGEEGLVPDNRPVYNR